MAERNPVVEEWISKAEGDWDWTEIDIWCKSCPWAPRSTRCPNGSSGCSETASTRPAGAIVLWPQEVA
jgi:hypothetical protein